MARSTPSRPATACACCNADALPGRVVCEDHVGTIWDDGWEPMKLTSEPAKSESAADEYVLEQKFNESYWFATLPPVLKPVPWTKALMGRLHAALAAVFT